MVISNIARPYGAMINDGRNSGLIGLWVFKLFLFIYIYIYIYILLVFLVLLRMGFLVFDFFCGFGCGRGLWLKWQFVGSVSVCFWC